MMLTDSFSQSKISHRQGGLYLLAMIAIAVTFTAGQDLLRAKMNNTAFYLSESLLYASFWLFFFPLLLLLYLAIGYTRLKRSVWQSAGAGLLGAGLHLLLTPLAIYQLSALFFDHTYDFADVLEYSVAEQLYLLVLVYVLAAWGLHTVFTRKGSTENTGKLYVQQLLVQNGRTSLPVVVDTIISIEAATPYVALHIEGKKLLHQQTLTAMMEQLDPECFVRVHRSSIVNLRKVTACRSRQNGDYDLEMENGAIVRLSRNYWPAFRSRFRK